MYGEIIAVCSEFHTRHTNTTMLTECSVVKI